MEVEFIGTGGQGAVLAAELLSNAAVKAGYNAQSFASYGQARRGGKVESYVRLAKGPILVRAKIRQPDYLVLMDESFTTWAQKMNLIKKGSTVLVNTPKPGSAFPFRRIANVATINADDIAAKKGVILASGVPVINTTMLGALCGLLPMEVIDHLPEAFKDLKIPAIEKNIAASREAFEKIKKAPEVPEGGEAAVVEAAPVAEGHFPQYRNMPAPCQANCPAGENIERVAYFVQHGHFEDALENIKKENPFSGICGRVCFHPCEVNCNRAQFDEGIAIQALERAAFDYADLGILAKPEKKPPTGKTVGIIGSGPAGMTCAYYLALLGHSVTVFEAQPVAGGVPRFGIPEYRLPKKIVDQEIQEIVDFGIDIKVNTKVGKDIAFDTITREYDACFIAAGAHRSMKLDVPGENSPGVISGPELLKQFNFGEKVDLGKRVAVIGGGYSAIDSARTAKRLGAGEVTIIYSRSAEEMLANATVNEERCSGCKLCLDSCPYNAISFVEERKLVVIDEALCKGCGACAAACNRGAIIRWGFTTKEEVNAVEEEGIKILYLVLPVQIHSEDKRVSRVECVKVKLGEKDKNGRRKSETIQGSNFMIDIDTVIAAAGETVELPFPDETVKMSGSVIKVDNLGRTSKAGVYAGGDTASLSRSVVEAIASGKRAALGIDLFLNGADQITAASFREGKRGTISMGRYLAGDNTSEGNGVVTYKDLNVAYFTEQPRTIMAELSAETRIKNFSETNLGFTREEAVAEAERCFHCGHCTLCEICYILCPVAAISLDPGGLFFTIKEEEGCQSCGICINECPRHAISWKGAVR